MNKDSDSGAFFCPLADRSLVRVSGKDCTHFLQNLVTCDVEGLSPGELGFGALLTPQGKILFDFFILASPESYIIDVDHAVADDFMRRLAFYRLRAKVDIEPMDPRTSVFAIWGEDVGDLAMDMLEADGVIARDPRLPAMGWRGYLRRAPCGAMETDADAFQVHRIAMGMPQGGLDYAYGDAFPHEALMDQFHGVDFAKGCYVGQEVVSRMQHRGTARKRLIRITSDKALPQAGTEILSSGKVCGQITSGHDEIGLAMVRIDRVLPGPDGKASIMAGTQPASLSIQEWLNFNWPSN